MTKKLANQLKNELCSLLDFTDDLTFKVEPSFRGAYMLRITDSTNIFTDLVLKRIDFFCHTLHSLCYGIDLRDGKIVLSINLYWYEK